MSVKLPSFTPKAKTTIQELSQVLMQNPDILHASSCPYDTNLISAINLIMVIGATRADPEEMQKLVKSQNVGSMDAEELNEEIDIERESKLLFNKLKQKMQTLDKMENNEQMQVFRTATSLLDKLLAANEKASNIKKFDAFKRYIIDSMDRYLTAKQKTEFVEIMAEVLQD